MSGETTVISPDTYTGPANRDIHFKGKAITVRSTDPDDPNIVAATIIECQNSGRGFYLDGCSGAAISGLTITQGYAQAGGGIYIEDSNYVTIANCRIIGNSTKAGENETGGNPATNGGDGAGIYCSNSSVVIRDCTVSSNKAGAGGKAPYGGYGGAGGKGGGICCLTFSRVTVEGCTIADNAAGAGGSGRGGGDGGAGGAHIVTSRLR